MFAQVFLAYARARVYINTNMFRKIIASLLCFNILFAHVPVALWASDISGISPEADGHTYNITPDTAYGIQSETGFRAYENFSLDAGDTANLVFTDDYSSFVNVVDNRININGFLNTVKNNGFYAGKAYFITKSGIVIGSSGVLNVGSLGLISSNSEKYSDYKTMLKLYPETAVPGGDIYRQLFITLDDNRTVSYNTSADIKIDGTVFAREAVKAYANSISVKDGGIVAGWNPSDSNILFGAGHRSFEDAKTMFNALVSGDVNTASFISKPDSQSNEQNRIELNAFAYQQGDKDDDNWKGSEANLSIENATLAAPEVELTAGTFVDSKHLMFDLLDLTGGIFADYAKASITIDKSTVKANTASFISSTASNSVANVNSLPPVLWVWLCNLFETQEEEKWNEGLGKLFSSDIFEHFDGTRSYSYLDIKDSNIEAKNGIRANTDAQANFMAETTVIPEILPQILYALGTQTESVVNIENSQLRGDNGIVDVEATSRNDFYTWDTDDTGLFKLSLTTDAYNFRFMNVGTSVNTAVNVRNSLIRANSITMNAFSFEDVFIKTEITATVGKNDFKSGSQGGSGAAFSFVQNNSDINTNVEIKNSTLDASDFINIKAENAAAERSFVLSNTTPEGYKKPEEIKPSDSVFGAIKNGFKYAKGLYDKMRQYTVTSIGSIFKAIYGKATGQVQNAVENGAGDGQHLDPALFQAAGSFAFSFLRNTNKISITDSALTAKNGIDIFSHIFDLSFNSAWAMARQADDQKSAIVGAGIAVVVNDKDNKNDIDVENSTLETTGDTGKTGINAITEIPGNAGSLGIDHKYLHLALKFNMDADDVWTAVFAPWDESRESLVLPTIGLSGFFSNQAVAGTNGDKAAVSASVVVNKTRDNTNVNITDSSIKSSDLSAYASNYITGRDSVGIQLNAPAAGVADLINLWNSDGTGGSVLVQNMEHNAAVNVKNSEIDLTGNADLGAASAQVYFNFLKQGTKAGTVGLSGAVEVQNIKGTTAVNVTDNSVITADGNISLNAGRTKSILGDMTYTGDVKGTPSTNGISSMYYRKDSPDSQTNKVFDITDHIVTIDILGDMTQQSGSDKTVSAAVGASVNVHDIDRDIQAVADNATLTSDRGNVKLDAYSSTKAVEFALAAAISGSAKPTDNNMGNWQNNAHNAGNAAQDAQDVQGPVEQLINDLEDGDGEDGADAAGGAAGGAGGTHFNLSASGSVIVFDNNQRVLSTIRNNSKVNAWKSVEVKSVSDNFNIFFSGALAKSGTAGLGSAVNIFTRGGNVKALVESSAVTAGTNSASATTDLNKVSVYAEDTTKSYNLAAGVGLGGNTEDSFALAVGGSFAYNLFKPEIEAGVYNSVLKGQQDNDTDSGTDVSVEAAGKVGTVDIAGGIDLANSNNITIGAAAAVTVDYMESNVNAAIENSVLTEKIRNTEVHAGEDIDLLGVGVSLALTGADSKAGFALDGSVGIVNLNNNIKADYGNNKTDAKGQVSVLAESDAVAKNIEGAGQYNGAQNGAGAGGAVVINIHNSTITAFLETGSNSFKAKGVSVRALSDEELNSIPVGIAVSKQSPLLASTVSVGAVTNTSKAYINGQVESAGDVLVQAEDQSYLLTRGGTLAASTSTETPTVIAAAVNVDVLKKDVEADISNAEINADAQTVKVIADSVDAFGGTKGEEDPFNPTRDDITSPTYEDKLMERDSDGNYNGIKADQGFDKWNMFWNLAAGSTVPIGGTVIIKNTDNNVRALVSNAKLNLKDLSVLALERQIKNIAGGQVAAGQKAAVGVQVVLTYDKSDVTASVHNGSEVTASGKTAIEASGIKDNNTVMVAAAGSGKVSGNVNVMYNQVSDNITASMEDSSLTSTALEGHFDLKATEDFNSTRVVVQAAGSGQGVAINVAPLVNDYKSNVFSFAKQSTITGSAAAVKVLDLFKTRDISVGVSGLGQGVAATGVAIRNNYYNTASAYAENLTGIRLRYLSVDAVNYLNSNNWAVGISGMGQGVALAAAVLINDVDSEATARIKDSDIEASGEVKVRVNKDDGTEYTDQIFNFALLGAGGGQGATVAGNFVFNYYNNTAKAIIENSAVRAHDIAVKAVSGRDLQTLNISASGTGMGGNVGINVTKNTVMTDTFARIDTGNSVINATDSVEVSAEDVSRISSDIGSASLAGLGGAGLANVNLIYNNANSHALITSAGSGEVNATDVRVSQNAETGISARDVGIVAAAGALAGDVTIIRVGGQDSGNDSYTKLETTAGVDKAESRANERQRNVMGSAAEESASGRGFTAEINGNVNARNNVEVSSSSRLEGYKDDDPFTLSNVNVSIAGGAVNVGWLSAKMVFDNSALISGGNVTAGNKVSVSALENDNALIENVKVHGTGLVGVEGGISSYSNNSSTSAVVKDAKVTAKDMDVLSDVTTTAKTDITDVQFSGGATINVAGYETLINAKSNALVTGNSDITAQEDLNIRATEALDVSGESELIKVSPVTGGYVANTVEGKAEVSALVKDLVGSIRVKNLNITTDYSKIEGSARSNIVSVSGVGIDFNDSSFNLNPVFISGIDSRQGGEIRTDTTNVVTARPLNNSNMNALTDLSSVEVNLAGGGKAGAYTVNEATSATLMKAKDHKADSLIKVDAYLGTTSKAQMSSTGISVAIGVRDTEVSGTSKSRLTVDFDGNNTAKAVDVNATHNAETNVSLGQVGAALLANVSLMDLKGDNQADTKVTLSGNTIADDIKFDVNTNRTGILNLSTGTGGFVNVASSSASNSVTGESELTIDGYNPVSNETKNISIKNSSVNRQQNVTSSSSGGFVNIPVGSQSYTSDTSAVLNVRNSNIYTDGIVSLSVESKNIVEDDASSGAGGVVSVAHESSSNSYGTSTALNIENTEIDATGVVLSASSDISTAADEVSYKISNGGFIPVSKLELSNTLTQNNEINITGNSWLRSSGNFNVNIGSGYGQFKQKADTDSSGFVAVATVRTTLNSDNTNKVSIESGSLVRGDSVVSFNFESNGNLRTYSHVKVKDAGSDPETNAKLYLTVNNTFDISGTVEAGKTANISFMEDSVNNLSQEAYSEHYALAPFTTEDGELKRTINNTLNITRTSDIDMGRIISGRDVNIGYSSGRGDLNSNIHYHLVYYSLFGKESYGSHSNLKTENNYNFDLSGEIIAGYGNGKKAVLKTDGSVDMKQSQGLYASDYVLYGSDDPEADAKRKQVIIMSLISQIEAEQSAKEKAEASLAEAKNKKEIINGELTAVTDGLDKIAALGNYTAETQDNLSMRITSELEAYLKNDQISGDAIAAEVLTAIESAFDSWYRTDGQGGENAKHSKVELFLKYAKEHRTDYNLSDSQVARLDYAKTEFIGTDANPGRIREVVIGSADDPKRTNIECYKTGETTYVAIYKEKGSSGENLLDNAYAHAVGLNFQIAEYSARIAHLEARLGDIENNLGTLTQELKEMYSWVPSPYEGSYAILFNPMGFNNGNVSITGIDNSRITPSDWESHIKTGKSGLEVRNYSTRTVLFEDIDFSQSDAAGYGGEFNGVNVVNYADSRDPFYTKPAKYADSALNNILFTRPVKLKQGMDFIVKTASGSIWANLHDSDNGKIDFAAEQGNVTITSVAGGLVSGNVNIKEDASIYAGSRIRIDAQGTINVAGTLTAGNNGVRTLEITEEMLEHLVLDPTTGEENMLDLSGTDYNVNAIYKDGKIYLFAIGETGRGVTLNAGQDGGSVSGTINLNGGSATVNIVNETDKPLVVNDIINVHHDAVLQARNVDVPEDRVVVNNPSISYASVSLNSNNKLEVEGRIITGASEDGNGGYTWDSNENNGNLILSSLNGLYVGEQFDSNGNEIPAIVTGSEMGLLSQSGGVEVEGIIHTDRIITLDTNDDPVYVRKMIVNTADLITLTEDITLDMVDVRKNGRFISNTKDIVLDNEDVSVKEGADVQLFTGRTGAFSLDVNASNRVETTAPVVIVNNPDLLVWNYLGYHTFDTLTHAETTLLRDSLKAVPQNAFSTKSYSFGFGEAYKDLVTGDRRIVR